MRWLKASGVVKCPGSHGKTLSNTQELGTLLRKYTWVSWEMIRIGIKQRHTVVSQVSSKNTVVLKIIFLFCATQFWKNMLMNFVWQFPINVSNNFVSIYRFLSNSSLVIHRFPDQGIFHQWHEKTCDYKSLGKERYERCLSTKYNFEGSPKDLAFSFFMKRGKQ